MKKGKDLKQSKQQNLAELEDIEYSDSGSDSSKIFASKSSKVKITQINVDDEDRIKADFMQKIIEDKNAKETSFEISCAKSKVDLTKEYSKTFGKGFAMLKKIGFQVGKGLGSKEQGMTQPIEIKQRERNKGISHEADFLNVNKQTKEDEADIYSANEFYDKKEFEMHKNKNQHKLKAGKKHSLKAKSKKEHKAKEEMDEFEKLVDKWSLIKEIIEKRKNKTIDFQHMENIDNDIDLVLERDVDIDVTKFLLQKTNSDNNDLEVEREEERKKSNNFCFMVYSLLFNKTNLFSYMN